MVQRVRPLLRAEYKVPHSPGDKETVRAAGGFRKAIKELKLQPVHVESEERSECQVCGSGLKSMLPWFECCMKPESVSCGKCCTGRHVRGGTIGVACAGVGVKLCTVKRRSLMWGCG